MGPSLHSSRQTREDQRGSQGAGIPRVELAKFPFLKGGNPRMLTCLFPPSVEEESPCKPDYCVISIFILSL